MYCLGEEEKLKALSLLEQTKAHRAQYLVWVMMDVLEELYNTRFMHNCARLNTKSLTVLEISLDVEANGLFFKLPAHESRRNAE